ncbi:ABC transporter permease [Spongiactinospora gelatinilytica]|uniref:ABC transporter permease n=1 Tax=Spongiactinospora gelatinilytica TaxID=2666298 RepID=A0A2W2FT91_9ACTN|nr:FtsX-like permease family protein [Spongiactinospora gelatinilytica]PZG38943.1 ABC transporter permease [Spongiactinospora gelatinilytica]
MSPRKASAHRAPIRWIAADLRARWGHALVTVLTVGGIVTALVAAATLLEGGTNPWRGLFDETNGAHVWIHVQNGQGGQVAAPTGIPERTGVAGPYRSAPVTLTHDGRNAPLALRALGPEPPRIARPVVREGRWLSADDADGVVLERSFAAAENLRPGGSFTVTALSGQRHELVVVGIAETAEQGFYPTSTPGLAWTLPRTLDQVEPVIGRSQSVIGLRLADPGRDNTVQVAGDSAAQFDGRVLRVSTWLDVQGAMMLDNRLFGLLLGLFGGCGLLAGGLAIAHAVGSRVLTQSRDFATLKSLGMTRAQVTSMLIVEHAALGLIGVTAGLPAGLAAGRFVTALSLHSGAGIGLSPMLTLLIAAGTAAVVILAAALPAWRAGRTPPTPAVLVAPPRGRLSKLARLALLVRLPPALVLGARDAFTRRLPAVLTVFGVMIPMMVITIGLGCLSTLDNILRHPEQVGQAAALEVRPGRLPATRATALITADPAVRAIYPGADMDAVVQGQPRTVLARAMGESARPYPFKVVEGRPYAVRGEAVAGQGLLDRLDKKIGQRVRVLVGGTPLIVRIVGRVVELEHDGEVLSFGIDSLPAKDATPPEFYSVVLKPGEPAEETAQRLREASGDALEVRLVVNPARRFAELRWMILIPVMLLVLIGLSNLYTASVVAERDHGPDLAVLKAMGLTPRQVVATMITGTGLLVLIGVVAGTMAGASLVARLIDVQGHTSGVGAGLGHPPSVLTLVTAAVAALALALLFRLFLARRAALAQVPVATR